jgi:hypothetical protein
MSGGSRCLLCRRSWRTAGTQTLIDLHGAPYCFRVYEARLCLWSDNSGRRA